VLSPQNLTVPSKDSAGVSMSWGVDNGSLKVDDADKGYTGKAAAVTKYK